MEKLYGPALLKLANRCGQLEGDCAMKDAYIEQLQQEIASLHRDLELLTAPDDDQRQ